jgi:hypothetical protein
LAKPIDRPGRRQADEQRSPIRHRLPAREIHRIQKGFLEAFIGIGIVTQNAAGTPPHRWAFRLHHQVPIDHAITQISR